MANTITFDTSGAAGQHGSSGISFMGSSGFSGQHGRNGGNATYAYAGQSADVLHLTMNISTNDVNAVVLNDTEACDVSTNIQLLAKGGRGGNGGNGGRGEDGARGRRGHDATRFSSGGNGGPGGDGGNGGGGTDGAPGGNGGPITISVVDADTHLLMMVNHIDFSGGAGGYAGRNGEPGRGGHGGSGGSSYSWTTSESYTDAQGNRQTRTHHHRNPGGFSGRNGRDGLYPTYNPINGVSGAPGSLTIQVENTKTQQIYCYSSIYHLELVDFQYESANKDGINEPGELVHVFNLLVRNIGGMPTPAYHQVFLNIDNAVHYTSENTALTIEHSIEPGDTSLVPGVLTLKLNDGYQLPTDESALRMTDIIVPHAHVGNVPRRFPGFSLGKEIVISFPVEITKFQCPVTICTGQTSRVMWEITNTSTRDLGENSESGRIISIQFALYSNEIMPADVTFTDNMGNEHFPLQEQFEYSIPLIRAGETFFYEGELGVSSTAPSYTSCRPHVTLAFGEIHAPNQPRRIQYRSSEFRISESYIANAQSKCLLVVNSETTREEITAWKELINLRLGLGPLSVWDVSLMGHLDLKQEIGSYRSCLMNDFKNRTIIILDNKFPWVTTCSTEASHVVYGSSLLPYDQYFEARTKFNIHFHVITVGTLAKPPAHLKYRQFYFPTYEDPILTLLNPKLNRKVIQGKEKEECSKLTDDFVCRVMVPRKFFSSDADKRLLKKCHKLDRKLRQLFPNERFCFKYTEFLNRETRTIGHIDIIKSFHYSCAENGLNTSFCDNEQLMHSTAYVLSSTLQEELMFSIPLEYRISILLSKRVQPEVGGLPLLTSIQKSLVIQAIHNISELLTSYQNHGVKPDQIRQQLSHLTIWLKYPIPIPTDCKMAAHDNITKVLSMILLFITISYTFKHKWMFNTRTRKVAHSVAVIIDEILFQWYSPDYQLDMPASQLDQLKKQWSNSTHGKHILQTFQCNLKDQIKQFKQYQKEFKSHLQETSMLDQLIRFAFPNTSSSTMLHSWDPLLRNMKFRTLSHQHHNDFLNARQQHRRTQLELHQLHTASQSVFFPESTEAVEIVLEKIN